MFRLLACFVIVNIITDLGSRGSNFGWTARVVTNAAMPERGESEGKRIQENETMRIRGGADASLIELLIR